MTWGFFSPLHIATLLFVPVFVVGILSFLGIAAVLYNLIFTGNPWENLPFHLCAFNAIALPIVVFTRSKTWGNVLLVWCLGAIAALILNNAVAGENFFTWDIFFYYAPHVVEFGIPLLLVSLGHVKKDPKCILSTVAITMALYTCVHFINLGLNKWFQAAQIRNPDGNIVFSNYMYSLEPNNPLCALFQKWIPGPYWFMYLVVPILVVYLLIVYAPEIIRKLKKK